MPTSCKAFWLQSKNDKQNKCALAISGEGTTRCWTYIIEIQPRKNDRPIIRILFETYYDTYITINRTSSGVLVNLSVCNSTCDLDDKEFPGHLYAVRSLTWNPQKETFRFGTYKADTEFESRLTLLEVLTSRSSSRVTDDMVVDENFDPTFYFRPNGILKNKVPASLRNAKLIACTIGTTKDNYQRLIIKKISAVSER